MKKTLLAFSLMALFAQGALAATAPQPSATDLPAPLVTAKNAGMQIVTQFSAVSGLTGWVLSQGGQYSVVFTTPDKQTLIAGALIDPRGKNLTAVYGDKYIPKPEYSSLFPRLTNAASITTGTLVNPKSTVYVMVDPNCIFCHLVWEGLKPYEAAGLQVKWVPVGFLKPTSATIAATMLAAKDPAAAFEQNETGFNDATETGGLAPMANVPPALAGKITANTQLMGAFGAHGTPTLVWKDAKGAVQVKNGMPRLSELPGITGLPAQVETSPDLARFR
jgi:thiol:disulfide interchange protein DsbG